MSLIDLNFSPEQFSDAIGERMRQRITEIDMVTNAVAVVYDMQEYVAERQAATSEVAARTIVQTEVGTPGTTPVEPIEVDPIAVEPIGVEPIEVEPIEIQPLPPAAITTPDDSAEVAQISDYEADARRRLAKAFESIDSGSSEVEAA